MKFQITITDWGRTIVDTTAKSADSAIELLISTGHNHPGANALIRTASESVELEYNDTPDFEAEILKLQKRELKKLQVKAAKDTHKKITPEKRRAAALKGWAKKMIKK